MVVNLLLGSLLVLLRTRYGPTAGGKLFKFPMGAVVPSRRLFSVSSQLLKASMENILSPPINRSMRELDRSFFRKIVPISAATVFDNRNISQVRQQLSKSHDILAFRSLKIVVNDLNEHNSKCILLKPDIICSKPETWSPVISSLIEQRLAAIRPYDLELTYDDWSMHDILSATIPLEDQDETPTGFAQVGHVAHINLREQYLPYKYLIGQVMLDKNANIRTVINKTEDVGSNNVFRTFPYEVIAGDDDMDVTVSESDCEFQFDFAKVYWNTRLNTEHTRIIDKFKKGQAVCDIMAGIGPFAVPAGKRGVFVWANDLNPDGFAALAHAVKRNKVDDYVQAFCMDGRKFIRQATADLFFSKRKVIKKTRQKRPKVSQEEREEVFEEPRIFSHYVMNLPATAVEFLDAFKGIYVGKREEIPHEALPFIHVYCFSPKQEDPVQEAKEVCGIVSTYLGSTIEPSDPEVEVYDVRLVSPHKKMFCASFRLPQEVAFAGP